MLVVVAPGAPLADMIETRAMVLYTAFATRVWWSRPATCAPLADMIETSAMAG
jgi:hypothetical protein